MSDRIMMPVVIFGKVVILTLAESFCESPMM
jgi:hypothetical protein